MNCAKLLEKINQLKESNIEGEELEQLIQEYEDCIKQSQSNENIKNDDSDDDDYENENIDDDYDSNNDISEEGESKGFFGWLNDLFSGGNDEDDKKGWVDTSYDVDNNDSDNNDYSSSSDSDFGGSDD